MLLNQSNQSKQLIQQEIMLYKQELKLRGIELAELVNLTPSCSKLRRVAKKEAYKLTIHQGMQDALKQSPPDEVYLYLQKHTPQHVNPKYVMALALLFAGDYQNIIGYLD